MYDFRHFYEVSQRGKIAAFSLTEQSDPQPLQ